MEQTLASSLISLVIGTLLGNEISRYLYRPRVKVKIRDVNPLITKDGYFVSIDIVNIGRSVAQNCTGYISLNNIERGDIIDSQYAEIDEILPSYPNEKINTSFPRDQLITKSKFRIIKNESLCWSKHGNPYELNINPGMTTRLDLFKAQKNKSSDWYLIFPSEEGWRKVRTRINFREITGRLLVCPSNEFPTIIDFKICNIDNKPTFKVIKYNIFKQIKRRIFRYKLLMT